MKWKTRLKSPPSSDVFSFCERHAESFDISNLREVSVFRGRKNFGVYGFMECEESSRRQPCHIALYLPGPFPYELTSLRNPIMLKIDPKGIPDDAYVASRNVCVDKSEVRVSLRSKVYLSNQDDAAVWLFGHEFFHFLTHTNQVDSLDTENNADEYGNFLLERWKLFCD